MTFETNHVIANVTFSDWLKSRASFSTNEKSQKCVYVLRCDSLLSSFSIPVIDQCNYSM